MRRNTFVFQSRSGPPIPFVSASLDEYLARYWAIVFTVGSRPIETGHMRHYLSWYSTRVKVVELDHHIHAGSLQKQIIATTGRTGLPILFVNKKVVGTIEEVKELEKKRLLKDVVQFGFQWKTGAGGGGEIQPLNQVPSSYNDTELFKGRYRGAQ